MERDLLQQNPDASAPAYATGQQPVHNEVNQGGQPFVPDATAEPEQEQQIDYAARARELEEQNAKLMGVVQNVQSWAEQQAQAQQQAARQQQVQQREQAILDRADTMPSDDARRYIAEEMRKLRDEDAQIFQGQLQQTTRALARPLFVDNLVKQYGLSDNERQRLLELENPDDAARMAPYLKAERERYAELQKQIDQIERSRQAQQIQGTGIGLVGGTNGPTGNIPLPTDPDERAALIYAQLKSGQYQGT